MKAILFFLTLLFFFPEHGECQEKRTLQTYRIKSGFNTFFEHHPEIDSIYFEKEFINDSLQLEIIEKRKTDQQVWNHFDLDNAGDRYFFKKRFGHFTITPGFLKKYFDPKANVVSFEGSISKDSMILNVSQIYYSKKQMQDGDIIFTKIENRVDYKKGMHILSREMETALTDEINKGIINDSVFVFRVIIKKDEKLYIDKQVTDNVNIALVKSITDFLQVSGPWIPLEACGRKVNAYKEVHAKLNRDKTFTIVLK